MRGASCSAGACRPLARWKPTQALANWLLARRHGGEFLLRLDDTDTERSRAEYAEAIEEDVPRGQERILLVEDEDMVRAVAERALVRAGFTVTAASNGEDAYVISFTLPVTEFEVED